MPRRFARALVVPAATLTALLVLPVGSCSPEPDVVHDPIPNFEDGFVELFDGSTLDGWVTKGGRYDGNARWTAEGGVLSGREGDNHAGGLIYTERMYSSFVFACEARVSYPFDSGVFVRMLPRDSGLKGAQVTLDYRPDGEVGAIYADGFLQHNKTAKDAFKRDEWNDLVVECIGPDMHIRFWLNGDLVTEYRLPDGSTGYASHGRIGLQVHGGRDDPEGATAEFRNIRIRELPQHDDRVFTCGERGMLEPTAVGAADGWKPLFNGRDLDGWEPVGSPDGYDVRDGSLVLPATGGGGYIRTTADYRDFDLRMDFVIHKMTNSGLFLRADRAGGDPAYSGCEIQILDDFNWEAVTGHQLRPWQFTGSLYASVPAGAHGALHPLGVWNTYEITYRGSRLRVALNGVELYDVDTHDVPVAYPDKKKFADRAQAGFIGLQRHAPADFEGDVVAAFRNIYIREL